jgi:uncharacterized Tic20 family protein
MPISVACPTCGTKLKAPDSAAGKKVKCPKCNILIEVPAEGGEAEGGVSTAPSSRPKADLPEDQLDEIDELPESGDDGDEAGDEGGEDRPKKKKKRSNEDRPLREDDKTWGLFAHLAGGIFGVLGALIVFMIKKDESAFLRHHTKESLNFQITMIIGWLVVVVLSCCIACGGGIVLGLAMGDLGALAARGLSSLPYLALGATNLILAVLQGMKAKNGEWSKYPFAIRLIK